MKIKKHLSEKKSSAPYETQYTDRNELVMVTYTLLVEE